MKLSSYFQDETSFYQVTTFFKRWKHSFKCFMFVKIKINSNKFRRQIVCIVWNLKSFLVMQGSARTTSKGRMNTIKECPRCKKSFRSKEGFKAHMTLHTGQFSFYCDTCRKGFLSATHYDAHMRSRQGLKYHCEYCSKAYVDKQKLTYHLSIHTGQYRFNCDKCGKGFNVKRQHDRHVSTGACV